MNYADRERLWAMASPGFRAAVAGAQYLRRQHNASAAWDEVQLFAAGLEAAAERVFVEHDMPEFQPEWTWSINQDALHIPCADDSVTTIDPRRILLAIIG